MGVSPVHIAFCHHTSHLDPPNVGNEPMGKSDASHQQGPMLLTSGANVAWETRVCFFNPETCKTPNVSMLMAEVHWMGCTKWCAANGPKRPNLVARFQPEMQQMTSPILTPHSDLLSKFQQRLIPITIAFCKGSWLTPQKYGWTIRLNMRGKWVSQASYFRGEFRYGGIQRQTVLGIPVKIKRQDSQNSTKKDGEGWKYNTFVGKTYYAAVYIFIPVHNINIYIIIYIYIYYNTNHGHCLCFRQSLVASFSHFSSWTAVSKGPPKEHHYHPHRVPSPMSPVVFPDFYVFLVYNPFGGNEL